MMPPPRRPPAVSTFSSPTQPEGSTPPPSYATEDDLARLGLSGRALLGVESETQDRALSAASRFADSYLGVRYSTPLQIWQDDLTVNVAQIAAWYVLRARGFDPAAPHDVAIREGFTDAVLWLQQVAQGLAELTPPIEEYVDPEDDAVQEEPGNIAIIQKPVF